MGFPKEMKARSPLAKLHLGILFTESLQDLRRGRRLVQNGSRSRVCFIESDNIGRHGYAGSFALLDAWGRLGNTVTRRSGIRRAVNMSHVKRVV